MVLTGCPLSDLVASLTVDMITSDNCCVDLHHLSNHCLHSESKHEPQLYSRYKLVFTWWDDFEAATGVCFKFTTKKK